VSRRLGAARIRVGERVAKPAAGRVGVALDDGNASRHIRLRLERSGKASSALARVAAHSDT